jgi:hypothetical protein
MAFVALPGVVAIAVPLALVGGSRPNARTAVLAGEVFLVGGLLLGWCVLEF